MPRARLALALTALLLLTGATTGASASTAATVPVAPRSSALGTAQSWAWKQYGSFAVKTVHGSGDDVIALPAHLRAAVVTATSTGQDNFVVWTLDSKNHEHDLLVNTIGAYKGADAFGLDQPTSAKKLAITAAGSWTITIRPVWRSTLLPASHTGDGVYLYDHSAAALHVTNAGQGNFVVWQFVGGRYDENLLINTIGHYSGTVPFSGGPTVFAVTSDGHWTFARR